MKNNIIWREPEVKQVTGISRSTRWRLMQRGEFPKKIQLSPRATGWIAAEIVEWLREKGAAR